MPGYWHAHSDRDFEDRNHAPPLDDEPEPDDTYWESLLAEAKAQVTGPTCGDDRPSPSAYIATNDRRELLQRAAVMLHRALDAPRHDEWPLDVAADLLTRAGEPGLAVRADAFASDREIVELMGEVEALRS